MPLYNYQCSFCSHIQDHVLKVDDRKIPEQEPCPHCGTKDSVHQIISAPAIVSGTGTNYKIDSGFKDVLSEMKKTVPNNNISLN